MRNPVDILKEPRFGSKRRISITRFLRAESSQPALRGSYALLANSAVTAVLGIVFWLLASRIFSVEEVGLGTATIAAILTAANLGQLNLYQTAGVLLASSSGNTRGTVRQILTAATISTTVLAALISISSKVLGFGGELLVGPAMFVLCAVAWTCFAVKDGIFVGLRSFGAIPLSNAVYGLLKILFLLIFSSSVGIISLIIATFMPLLLLLPIIIAYIWSHATVDHAHAVHQGLDRRFIGIDYVGFIVLQLCTTLLPFLVLILSNAKEAGVFAIIWLLVSMIDTLAHSAGVPLAAEASRNLTMSKTIATMLSRRSLVVVGLAVVVSFLLADLILSFYGKEYSNDGSLAFRVLVLASLPRAYSVISIAFLRAHRRVGTTTLLEVFHAAIVMCLAVIAVPTFGVMGIAVAWLAGQLALAGACLIVRRRVRSKAVAPNG